jgi:hypothetical protein
VYIPICFIIIVTYTITQHWGAGVFILVLFTGLCYSYIDITIDYYKNDKNLKYLLNGNLLTIENTKLKTSRSINLQTDLERALIVRPINSQFFLGYAYSYIELITHEGANIYISSLVVDHLEILTPIKEAIKTIREKYPLIKSNPFFDDDLLLDEDLNLIRNPRRDDVPN